MDGVKMDKFMDKLDKLNYALKSLNEMIAFESTLEISIEKMEEAIRDSIIKKFEYTFELTWKTIKVYLENEGYIDISSPKRTLKQAFEIGLISNEEIWANMLEARNSTAHTYDEEKACFYEDVIKKKYIKEIIKIVDKLNKSGSNYEK